MKSILLQLFSRRSSRRQASQILTIWFTLLCAQSVEAGINICKQPDGTVTFQDSACLIIPKKETKQRMVVKSIPFEIHKSWFEKPSVVPDRPQCTDEGCHCGMFSRKFDSGLALAVADALYLDGNWHRLESKQTQLENAPDNPIKRADLLNEIDEAACDILISQQTLRQFGRDTLRKLREKKHYAENRGLDNPEDCDAGDETVCEYTDIIGIYQRIQSDIRALRNIDRTPDETESVDNKLKNEFADIEKLR